MLWDMRATVLPNAHRHPGQIDRRLLTWLHIILPSDTIMYTLWGFIPERAVIAGLVLGR